MFSVVKMQLLKYLNKIKTKKFKHNKHFFVKADNFSKN